MIKVYCEQGSDEWFKLRAGNPGASNFDRIITTKGEPSKQRKDYLFELAGELIAGPQLDGYKNAAMERGNRLEAEARELFSLVHGPVEQVGLCYIDENQLFHASPDSLTLDENIPIELKNPYLKTHAKYLYENKLPTDYFTQVQGQIYICNAPYGWFMSNYPGMPPLIIKVMPDDGFLYKLEKALLEFCAELKDIYSELLKRVA